ncbi:MAG: PEP-CTERM sorting domain-containing protein, partial [Phycisphaerae bacterium]|nr:PEP-CTERM sorting domain-containing protein [Phycisphaerae bacterium]
SGVGDIIFLNPVGFEPSRRDTSRAVGSEPADGIAEVATLERKERAAMRTGVLICALTVCILCIPINSARGELLNLSIEHYPRTYSLDIQVTYDPDAGPDGNGLLTADGWPWEHYEDADDGVYDIWNGVFDLDVVIDPTTGQAVSGTLNVTGDPYGSLETLFYSTTLTQFGCGGDDLFEFVFTQEGAGIPPEGAPIGIILSAVSITEFDENNEPVFDTYFDNNGNGYSNTFYLPEPSSAVLLALVGLGLLRRRRLRGC